MRRRTRGMAAGVMSTATRNAGNSGRLFDIAAALLNGTAATEAATGGRHVTRCCRAEEARPSVNLCDNAHDTNE